MIAASVRLDPDPRVILRQVRGAVQRKVLRKAIRQALKPMQRALKAGAQAIARTGALARSQGTKVSTRRKGRTTGVAGPRADFQVVKDGVTKKPVKYMHLAEKRHRFAAAAFHSSVRQWIEVARRVIEEEVGKELAKG